MTFWKKHRFLSLDEEDETDKVMSGSQFFVKYFGSTDAREDFHGFPDAEEDNLASFYGSVVKTFQAGAACLLRMVVDISGVVLYDKMGTCVQRFLLSDIKDIVYCEKKHQYRRYVILVGREESDPCIKAYIFTCESKQQAKQIYKLFIQTFTIGAQLINNNNDVLQESKPLSLSDLEVQESTIPTQTTTGCAKTVASNSVRSKPNGGSPQLANEGIYKTGIKQEHVFNGQGSCLSPSDDCFTELARSRSGPSILKTY